jgi:preprotein translocase subunit SecD
VRRYRNWIILAVVAALVAASVYFIIPPSEKTHLGLDLQGGVEVVYTAKTADGGAPTQEQLDQTVAIIDRRVNGLGVTESQVKKQGTDQISVALPGVQDPEQALAIIGKTAQLEFFEDYDNVRIVGPVASRDEAIKKAQAEGVPKKDLERFRKGDNNTDDYALVYAAPGAAGNQSEVWFVYKRPPAMTGDAIDSARQSFDQNGRPNVEFTLTDSGAKTFQKITKKLYDEGLFSGVPQTFAIVLDNRMESDPRIDYTDQSLADGIAGGKAEITGDFTVQEAKDLALVLNTGALPVELEATYQQQVSATLGADSLRAGLIAGLAGLLLVLIYMVAFYRFLGVVADLALITYGILLWGLYNAIPVTLTLPGIAGVILTIGMAADANVVIFERIKEEVRRGKTVRSAVNSGFTRGFMTILDANILTILTAAALFLFATQQVKGFAFTLITGVLVSMVTAVLATRALLGVLSEFTFFNRPAFMGVTSAQMEEAAEREAVQAGAGGSDTRGGRRRGGEGRPLPATDAAGVLPGGGSGPRRPSTAKKKRKRR